MIEHGLGSESLDPPRPSLVNGYRQKPQYSTEEGLRWLNCILLGDHLSDVCHPPIGGDRVRLTPNAAAYAIVKALTRVTAGLAKEGKRLDLVIVEVADGSK